MYRWGMLPSNVCKVMATYNERISAVQHCLARDGLSE